MKAKKVRTTRFNLFLQRIPNEQVARKYSEDMRWNKGWYCPHCTSTQTVHIGNEKPQPYHCKDYRKHFSVRTGTVLTAIDVPLQKWLLATYLMTTIKKSVSNCQMFREVGVTQKTTWLLCHKINEMWTVPLRQFIGEVETDETYLGGKKRISIPVETFKQVVV